jgi:3-mercaptopyruvate sulfurtransferase SseA
VSVACRQALSSHPGSGRVLAPRQVLSSEIVDWAVQLLAVAHGAVAQGGLQAWEEAGYPVSQANEMTVRLKVDYHVASLSALPGRHHIQWRVALRLNWS